jgi:hypothetical protein
MYAVDGRTKTQSLQRLLFYSWLAKDLLPHHCLQNVDAITRCLPMWKLAFPEVTLKVFQDFQSLYFLRLTKDTLPN